MMTIDTDKPAISAAELQALIESVHAPAIIDVHFGIAFASGHIPGALHLPFWLALGRARKLDIPRHKPVVVYCAHGPRAALGKLALKLAGFKRVCYLDGHMSGWIRACLPLEK